MLHVPVLQLSNDFEMLGSMARIGPKDAFEQDYTERFRSLLRGRGVFVQYEYDRATRDIGIHFTKPRTDGGQDVTSALAWFQLKGIMATTMSADKVRKKPHISYSLYVEDLRFWYLQPTPTYLALYIESAGEPVKLPKLLANVVPEAPRNPNERGQFLILNLKKYVSDRWGRTIFDLTQKKVSVELPTSSILDEHALDLIVRESDQAAWSLALGVEPIVAKQCLRDHQLIWRMGTADERRVVHRVQYRAWISKRRTTLSFEEHAEASPQWVTVREHWAQSLPWPDVEAAYPFLHFFTQTPPHDDEDDDTDSETVSEDDPEELGDEVEDSEEEDDDDDDDDGDDDGYDEDGIPRIKLQNGDRASGEDLAGEYEETAIRIALNKLGRRVYRHVCELVRLGFISVDLNRAEFLSTAHWDARSV